MVMPNVPQKNSPCPAAAFCRAVRATVLGILLLPGLFQRADLAHSAVFEGPYIATLNWDVSPDPRVVGYRIYYGTNSGSYSNSTTVGNVTSNSIFGLAAGVTYFVAVTDFGTNGIESAFSREVSFVPGQPMVQVLAAPKPQFALIVGGLTGHSYDIEATQDFKTWAVIGNVTMDTNGATSFTDTNAALFPTRFYRTRATP
jgi:hypothetical protein